MSPSFFEKLTGISNEDEPETEQEKEQEAETPTKVEKKSRKKEEKIIKESLNMPKTKKIKNISDDQQEGEVTLPEKEKSWLEEADTEEGQLTIDVYQTDQEIVIKSTIAGVKPEDVDISINNDMVTVRGKRSKDEEISTENYYYQELYWGTFSRSVILPVEVDPDRAKATIKNGILTIRLPKTEKIKTKKISVRTEE